MKRKNERKDRIYQVEGEFVATSPKAGFCVKDGKMIGLNDGMPIDFKNCQLQAGYARANPQKPFKVLNMSPLQTPYLDPNSIFIDFDVAYAVDTNTKKEDDGYFSVGVLVCGEFLHKDDHDIEIKGKYETSFTSFNPQQPEGIEQRVWKAAIQYIIEKNQREMCASQRILIIVDCDLGNIPLYNNRTLPIVPSFYLPQNCVLSYASSDAGKESIANKMISMCDSLANELYDLQYRDRNK